MEKRRFQIFPNDDKSCVLADFTVSAPSITGAEQNLILLDANLHAIAIIEVQPEFDRREIPVVEGTWPNQ